MNYTHTRTLRGHPALLRHVKPVAAACAVLMGFGVPAAQAQQAAAAAKSDVLETVVITGIRKSLETSLNLKRSANGVVDGIVAEDIGKFPDTNLAESLQRIAGVAIDRSANGEGSRVTVRGLGPSYNLTLLNGRQMPAATINEGNNGANGDRSFNYANLSADAISALEVFKTSRALSPTGGMGATINIKSARPLDTKERVASLGIKFNHDDSNNRLPESFKGSSITPEVSGLYSEVFADGMLGIGISGSYSKRDSGSNQAYTQNGWRTFTPSSGDWGSVPNSTDIKNRPTTGVYSTSVDMRYSITAIQRERVNGQAVLQFAPSKDLKFTLDHTMANSKASDKNAENSSWFNFSFNRPTGDTTTPYTTFTNGPVASPLIQSSFFNNDHDYAINNGLYAAKSQLGSTGFNAEWKVSPDLKVEFDAHHSTSKVRPNSPYGTYTVLDVAMFAQGNAIAYYDKKLPILSLPNTTYDPNALRLSGSQFVNNLADQDIDQFQTNASYKLSADDKLNAGLGFTKLKDRRASYNHQNDDWGGVGKSGDFANVPVSKNSLGGLFTAIPGHDDPRLYSTFYQADFNALRATSIEVLKASRGYTQAQAEAYLLAAPDYSRGDDYRTQEKSTYAFVSWERGFEWGVPMNVSAGLRYEGTKINSSSQVVSRTSASWISQNEYSLQAGPVTFGNATGKYSYLLPSIDWDADLTTDIKVRASYGENIGRPGFNSLLGGVNLAQNANAGGGSGSTGNPNLKPWLSKNLDLSAEYYYAKGSYFGTALFFKKVSNFIGGTSEVRTYPGVNTPVGGAYYQAAQAACGANAQPLCLRNYIFTNFKGQPGVNQTGVNPTGEILGSIDGLATDPLLPFQIGVPSNGKGDKIKGLEINLQHTFGSSGFGFATNLTFVRTGLKYDVANTGGQTALLGVSNNANVIAFYEDDTWSTRIAVNRRGQFLASGTDGSGNSPVFVEPYTDVAMNVSYKLGKNLTFTADVLNLTDSYQRAHARTTEALQYAIQTGRRYLVGARYKF